MFAVQRRSAPPGSVTSIFVNLRPLCHDHAIAALLSGAGRRRRVGVVEVERHADRLAHADVVAVRHGPADQVVGAFVPSSAHEPVPFSRSISVTPTPPSVTR